MFRRHYSVKQIRWFLLNDLSPLQKEKMEIHLNDCPRCSRLLEEEKSLFNLLKKQSARYPSAEFLKKSRKQLIEQLGSVRTENIGQIKICKSRSLPFFNTPKLQLAVITVVFLFGLFIGRFFMSGRTPDHSVFNAGDKQTALTSSVNRVDIVPVNGGFHEVRIRFTSIHDETVQGRINDPEIQNLLFYLMRNAPQDNIRLKVINLLQQMEPNPSAQSAVAYALEKDQNPGIRMRAIKILNEMPLNDELVKILKNAFLKDTNSGIRIKAAESLSRWNDPDITPILENEAEDDEYVRALMIMNESETNKQQTRVM